MPKCIIQLHCPLPLLCLKTLVCVLVLPSIRISDIILADVHNCINNHHHNSSDRIAYSVELFLCARLFSNHVTCTHSIFVTAI